MLRPYYQRPANRNALIHVIEYFIELIANPVWPQADCLQWVRQLPAGSFADNLARKVDGVKIFYEDPKDLICLEAVGHIG